MRSVVVASFQGERFIGAQLDSILPQLSHDDELIVSDDCSTDQTLQIIARRSDPRIRVIANSARVGYAANFERAIRAARGDLVLFSDQDDIWLPDKVVAIDAAARRGACVASDAIVVDENLKTVNSSFFALRHAKRFTWLTIYLKPSIVGATLACRKDYLQKLLPFPAKVPHDFWITLNAVLDNELTVLRSPLILYRRHAEAASVSATGRRRRMQTIVAERARILIALALRRLIAG